MEEVTGETDFNVKVEPDEVVLYGCHLCQDIIFEDYGDLEKHLEEHLDTNLKQVSIESIYQNLSKFLILYILMKFKA